MSRINSRNKGANGEREFAKWIQDLLDLPEAPERNLEQTRSGGWDLLVTPFAFEVKRVQTLSLRKWWLQAKRQVDVSPFKSTLLPVVAYRQNRQPWRGLISAEHIGIAYGYVLLDEIEFKTWLIKRWKEFNGYGKSGKKGLQKNRTFTTTEEQVVNQMVPKYDWTKNRKVSK